jgi:hypothetical protein
VYTNIGFTLVFSRQALPRLLTNAHGVYLAGYWRPVAQRILRLSPIGLLVIVLLSRRVDDHVFVCTTKKYLTIDSDSWTGLPCTCAQIARDNKIVPDVS